MRFRLKLTLSILALMSLAFGAMGSILIGVNFTHALDREKESARSIFNVTADSLGLLRSHTLSDSVLTLSRLQNSSCAALSLEDDRGILYAQGPAALLRETAPETGCSVRLLRREDAWYISVCGRILAGEESMILRLVFDASPIYAARKNQQQTYLTAYLLVLFLGGALSWIMARVLTRPLGQVTQAAEALGSGSYSSRVNYHASDEFGTLAAQFNSMADALQAQMQELREDVARQERFLGAFAHELKTPMTSIIGYADLIRSDTLDTEERMRAGSFLYGEGKRLEHLSWRLLELLALKNEPPALQWVRVDMLLESLADRLRPAYAEHGITLLSTLPHLRCLAEPDLLISMTENLLDNARKAVQQGGTICLTAQQQGSGITVSVSDNGIGIPPDSLRHLAEPFYRVDKARSRQAGGVGLGLSLCKDIAALHGGELHFESIPGQGTTVTFTLEGESYETEN